MDKGGWVRDAFPKHELERPSSRGRFEIDLTSQRIGLGTIVLAKYEFKRPTTCSGRRSAGIMFFQSTQQVGCKADIQTAIIGAQENINAERKWHIHFLQFIFLAP